jgi:hypothetical protein
MQNIYVLLNNGGQSWMKKIYSFFNSGYLYEFVFVFVSLLSGGNMLSKRG